MKMLFAVSRNVFSNARSLRGEKNGWLATGSFILFLGIALLLMLFHAVSPIAPFVYSLF